MQACGKTGCPTIVILNLSERLFAWTRFEIQDLLFSYFLRFRNKFGMTGYLSHSIHSELCSHGCHSRLSGILLQARKILVTDLKILNNF
jgi:hypothetical protein